MVGGGVVAEFAAGVAAEIAGTDLPDRTVVAPVVAGAAAAGRVGGDVGA